MNRTKPPVLQQQKIQIICLPYSGGSGFAFQALAKYWTKSWQVHTITYPGRGRRIREELVYTTEALVNDSWEQMKGILQEPYILFGHSLGSTLAYLLAHKARETGYPLPAHLFLSGKGGPSLPSVQPCRYLFSKTEFKEKLKSYGGISDEILYNKDAFDFFEPIIRADFQAIETWQYTKKTPLNIPATVITGTKEDMTELDIRLWQKEFIPEVSFKKMNGNHFFLFNQSWQFVKLLQQEWQKTWARKINQMVNVYG